jgi:gamma-glutamyltranspeptidase / glutathione hydrolase
LRQADGKTNFIDFREKAPAAATRDMYLDELGKPTRDSLVGWRAPGVPGTVRGLELAHKKYGKLPWAKLVAPAVRLASTGFPVSYALSQSLKNEMTVKLLGLSPESKRIFLKGGAFHDPDDKLVQPELGKTLARIAASGSKDFYEGVTAKIFAEQMARNGGLITLADLKSYQAVERKPLQGSYKGYGVITAPPPSSGGIGILQMMGMLEGSGYEKSGPESASSIHYLAEAMRRYYADRSEYLGDPDFVKVPVFGLLQPSYTKRLRETIDREKATPSAQVRPGRPILGESSETTHFNVVDTAGNAVALTYTLNGGFGNGVTVPGLGFLLNNEMDDFSAKPGSPNLFGLVQGEANAIQPGKRPLSSMTPTILTKDGELFMVVGAPGGSRIITAVLQVILNVVDFGMNVQDAVDAPRFHHQWLPDRLEFERGISPDTLALLAAKGHKIEISRPQVLARVEAILRGDGWLQGGSDGRYVSKTAAW